MKALKKRLWNLAAGELAASVTFVIVYHLYVELGEASRFALYFLLFQLLQGTAYWGFRARTVGREPSVAAKGGLSLLSSVNLISAMIILPWIVEFAKSREDLTASLLLYAFAVIEYVNYYWYRLSYGKSGFHIGMLLRAGLRPSSIRKLIQKK